MMLMMMRLFIYLYARLYPGATIDARDVCIAALKILILHFWPQVYYTHCTLHLSPARISGVYAL